MGTITPVKPGTPVDYSGGFGMDNLSDMGYGFMAGGPIGAVGAGAYGAYERDQNSNDLSGLGSRISAAEHAYKTNPNNYTVPGYNPAFQQYGNMADRFGSRGAQQASDSAFRNNQVTLGNQLSREAGGNGIGQQLIRQQAQGQADRGMQQQMAMAASARPGQGALATRQAMMNSGNMNAQVGGQSAQAAGQYQLGAMNNYGQFLTGARGQDQQQNQFNTDMRFRQLGLNDTSQMEALRQRLQLQQMQQQGGMNYEAGKNSRFGAAAGQPTNNEQNMAMMQGMMNAYAMSK